MKKRKIYLLIISMSLFTILCFNSFVLAQNNKEYEEFLKQPYLYSQTINYLHKEEKAEKPLKLELQDYIFIFTPDLFLALFCIWLTIFLLTGSKTLSLKSYLWFFFVFNFAWFIFLLLLKGSWQVLDFLVVKLQPDLGPQMMDAFSLIVIITAIFVYIWLLARTFNLNFFGASGTFLASHLLYFLILFLFFLWVNPKENKFLNLAKENLGIRPTISSYLNDADKITSGQNTLSLIRVRPFHL